MKLLCATVSAALCFAIGGTINIGPLDSEIKIGIVEPLKNPITPEDENAANNVIGFLEYARRFMPVGINKIVKATEPYSKAILPPVKLNGSEGPLEGVVTLTNLVASGAQKFTIHKLQVSFNSSRLDFHISVPQVVVDVDFEGVDLVLDDILIFNTSGHCVITLTGLDIEGAFGAEYAVSPSLYVTGMEIVNKVDNVEVSYHNRNGIVPEVIVQQVTKAIAKSVAETAWDELDAVFSHFSTEQMLKFLKG